MSSYLEEDGKALIESGRRSAFDEVLAILDHDIARCKDCGDFVTAEALEVERAKIKAHSAKGKNDGHPAE